MIRFIFTLWFVAIASFAQAQSGDTSEKSRIEAWLEETLSAAGRDVVITGLTGAFSSEASFEKLTFADDDGIWLSLENAKLNWSRSALLSGRIEINEIAAETISVIRKPLPGPAISTETSQSFTFTVPDLPVSVEIDAVEVANIKIDEAVLGQAIDLSLKGKATLIDGQMDVDLQALRNGAEGQFKLLAKFENETRQLDIDLLLSEPQDGIAATLLKIPDAPALELSVKGAAPLSDFAAELALQTNGATNVSGEIRFQEAPLEGDRPQTLGIDIAGDLRPLFTTEFHPFFGTNSAIRFASSQNNDGTMNIEQLHLETGVVTLDGTLSLASDGLPNRFDLVGSITSDTPVRLPVSGPSVTLGELQFNAAFDASQSNSWTADIGIGNLAHPSLSIPVANVNGTGTIDRSFGKKVTGDVSFQTNGLTFADDNISRALGNSGTGRILFNWSDGEPLTFEAFDLKTDTAEVTAKATLGAVADGLPVAGFATIEAPDLNGFSGVASRALGGAARATIEGRYDLIGGGFDGKIDADTLNLAVGEARIDPLLAGNAKLAINAARTPEGTMLRSLDVGSTAAKIRASGQLNATAGIVDLAAQISELSLVEPSLSGSGDVKAQVGWTEEMGFQLSDLIAKIANTQLAGDLSYVPATQNISADLSLQSTDISAFAGLAQRPIAGSIDLKIKGGANPAQNAYAIDADFTGDTLKFGIPELDTLLNGAIEGTVTAQIDANRISLDDLRLNTPLVSMIADNEGRDDYLSYTVNLQDVAAIAPGFNGPFTLTGEAQLQTPDGRNIAIDARARGPAGLTFTTEGRVQNFGETVDLSISGAAPLGLANSFIAPNSVQGSMAYTFQMRGKPSLSALAGQATLSAGRAALPDSGIIIEKLVGDIGINNGEAQINLSGASTEGGTIGISGPVSLQSGNVADLRIDLNRFGVTDPNLFSTDLSGQIRVSGALPQSARITGGIRLGTTEVVVPSGNVGAGLDIADVNHIGAPGRVYATLDRAGVGPSSGVSSSNGLPLDITITAPNQIFVRGRGLDAELGGQLRVGGTTSDVSASGNFDLIRGRFDILGRRFTMTEGLINLRGSLDPFLRFVAETQTDTGSVRIILEGLASDPDLSFASDPDLPQEEAIAQLLFGRNLESISPLQAASLVSAIATLSGRSSGGITTRLRSALGLSDFDVTTTQSGAQQLRAGAYISENIYSEITIDSEGNQAIDLNLDITPNLKARGGTNSQGNTGIGIFFEKDY